jgi:PAS domain S-box-containing protein
MSAKRSSMVRKPSKNRVNSLEERYLRLFAEDLTGDCLSTPRGEIITCNPSFLRMFGFPSTEEALRTGTIPLFPKPEEHEAFLTLLKERGKLERYDCVRRRWDGVLIDVVENAVGTFDPKGRLVEIMTYSYDDTGRKRAQRFAAQASERYRALVELIPDAILVSDEDVVCFANPAAASLLGTDSPEELVGNPLSRFFHPQYHQAVRERTNLAMKQGLQLPLERRRMVRFDGTEVEVETAVGPCDFDGKQATVRVSRDITERVQYEDSLRRKDEELSRRAGKLERLNDALKVLLEHRGEEIRQKEQNMRVTLDRLVLPYLEALDASRLTDEQRTFVEIIDANLRKISSSLPKRLALLHERLAPTEMQVADLVISGKRSKEIANILRISESSVATHRTHIRTKLGLKGQPTNLTTYLRDLSTK